jgi:predicted DNA-binding transcriptional regulator AlpA
MDARIKTKPFLPIVLRSSQGKSLRFTLRTSGFQKERISSIVFQSSLFGEHGMPLDQSLHTIEDVCDVFKCSKSTVWRWAAAGSFPKPVKINGIARWTDESIREFIRTAQAETSSASTRPKGRDIGGKLRRPKLSPK